MKLCIFTLCLDGMPYIQYHLPIFKNLKHDWKWVIVHGAAMNNGSTQWCAPQEPRLSEDGTTEYLHDISESDPRIILLEQPSWSSKDEMVNVALFEINEPCVLMEIDSDEIWRVEQLDKIVELFEQRPYLGSIMFACDYHVGPNLKLQGEHCYGDNDYEWLRVWRYQPGMHFSSHEPPILSGWYGIQMNKLESIDLIGRFSHYAYATEQQVAFKEKFYQYHGLLEKWKLLQAREDFPIPLCHFFDHVKGELPLVVKA